MQEKLEKYVPLWRQPIFCWIGICVWICVRSRTTQEKKAIVRHAERNLNKKNRNFTIFTLAEPSLEFWIWWGYYIFSLKYQASKVKREEILSSHIIPKTFEQKSPKSEPKLKQFSFSGHYLIRTSKNCNTFWARVTEYFSI